MPCRSGLPRSPPSPGSRRSTHPAPPPGPAGCCPPCPDRCGWCRCGGNSGGRSPDWRGCGPRPPPSSAQTPPASEGRGRRTAPPGLPAQPPVGGQGPLQVLPLQAPPRGDDGEAAGPCRLIPAAGRQDLIFRQEGVFLRLGAVVAGLGAKFAVLSALAAAPVDNGAQGRPGCRTGRTGSGPPPGTAPPAPPPPGGGPPPGCPAAGPQ